MPAYPVVAGLLQATRLPGGGVGIDCRDGWLWLNDSLRELLFRCDGSTPFSEVAAPGSAAEAAIAELVGHGVVGLLDRPARGGYLKTTRLSTVSVEIIQQCNQNCRRCYLTGTVDRSRQLSVNELAALFSDLAAYGVGTVTLSGGEPLMRPDLLEIIAAARRIGHEVCLATNGTLLNKRLAIALRRLGIRMLQISVDGDEATHDGIRRSPGAYEAMRQAFRACQGQGLDAYAITIVSKVNVDSLIRVHHEVAKLGARGHMLNRYVPSGVADDDYSAPIPLFQRALHALSHRREIPILSCDPAIGALLGQPTICGAGYYAASISADGNVKPCDALPYFVGNVREKPFAEIAETSALFARCSYRHVNLTSAPPLADDACYGCFAYQFMAGGAVDTEDPYHPGAAFVPRRSAVARLPATGVPYVGG